MMEKSDTDNWVNAIQHLQERGSNFVLLTLLGARGSTPRASGTKMVVSAQQNFGTIGGGHLEYKAIEIASKLLEAPCDQQHIEHFPLGASLGQCCGGSTTVLFESFNSCKFNIMLFGAGHVGLALSDILRQLPCKLHWVDNREGQHPVQPGNNIIPLVSDQPAQEVADMPAGSDFLIMTHNHQLDFEILEAVLKRGDARYIGLIGSETKWRRFKLRLQHKGYEPEFYQHVHCPIGLAEVPGKRPIEVAVSIAGELIALNHQDEPARTNQAGVPLREAQGIMAQLKMDTHSLDDQTV